MPRAPRIEIAGGLHHVTARTPSRRLLFHDDDDRRLYLGLLGTESAARDWKVCNFCLMSNHVHVLVRTPEPDLGAGIKVIHERFARLTNADRTEHGHLFGDRFHNTVVADQHHFAAAMRYISRNPVAAGLCSFAEEWHWSGHNTLLGRSMDHPLVDVETALGLIGERLDQARLTYAGWVVQPDEGVLATLRATAPGDAWLIAAVEAHGISVPTIMAFTGWSQATVYRRLARARENRGTVPSFLTRGSAEGGVRTWGQSPFSHG